MPINGISANAALNAYTNAGSLGGVGANAANSASFMGRAPKIDGIAPIGDATNQPSFADIMKETVTQSVDTIKGGEEMSAKAITGEADLVDVVQAVNSAELTLQTMVTVRDKMISAYQDIMRMPI